MVENGEADDKIIAALVGDPTFGALRDVGALPRAVVDGCGTTSSPTRRFPGHGGDDHGRPGVRRRRGTPRPARVTRRLRAQFGTGS
jgi:hypothetical protein